MTMEARSALREKRKHMYFVVPVIGNAISDEVIRTVHEMLDNRYIITTAEHPTWNRLDTMAENGVQLALERGETVYGFGITGEREGCIGLRCSVKAVCDVLGIEMTPRQKALYADDAS